MAIVNKPSDYFETKLWAGNGSSQNITGLDFQPDWVWIKSRTDTRKHNVYDSVRGVQKRIVPNSSVAEDTASGLTAFGTNGFTVGSETDTNGSGRNFVGWSWKAGGSASSNSAGSITSSVSANQDAGFSIVTYTGGGGNATVGHGLGVAPGMMIIKNRSASQNWVVYHQSIGNTKNLYLNNTDATNTTSGWFNNTSPTSTVFTIGNDGAVSGNGNNLVAYCFAEKQGYSKFGSYTGNGSTDGTFVYTGFKPAFTLIKRTDSATGGSWILFDNKRGTNVINPVDVVLAASNNQTEADWGTTFDCDYLSNGFKWRFNGTAGYNNASGATYIYMAFAENPFVTSTDNGSIPACAR